MNECIFSPDRLYRFTLKHVWSDMLNEEKLCMWIGLNPSTADENELDPTLRRIKGFSKNFGYTGFIMTNLYAYRSTDPSGLFDIENPSESPNSRPSNDYVLIETARRVGKGNVFAAWGAMGLVYGRGRHVFKMLEEFNLKCLGTTKLGHPCHPLYLSDKTEAIPYEG